MKLKVKEYIEKMRKYTLIAFMAVTLVDLALLEYFGGSEFRTTGYKIHAYAFRVFDHLLPFWIGYFIYRMMNPKHKISASSFWIRFLALGPLCLLFFITFFFGFFGSYGDGSYDRCMEQCVAEDLSNYNECTFSTCDFPI